MRLTDLLISDGVLDAAVVEEVLRYKNLYGGSIDTNLLETGLLDERRLQPFLEKTHGLKNQVDPFGEAQAEALRLLKREQAETYRLVPIRLRMRALDVLVHDPTNVRAIDEVGFITGCRLILNVASEARVADHLQRWYQVPIPERLKAILAGRFARQSEMSLFAARRAAERAPTEPIELPPPASPTRQTQPPTGLADDSRVTTPRFARPERSVEVRRSYEQLGAQLAAVTNPDEVPGIVLPYLHVLLPRVVLFLVYPEHMQGWDARGARLKREAVELLRVSLTKPSVFLSVLQTGRAFEGRIPQEEVEEHLLIRLAGAQWPEHALVVPVRGRDTAVGILYGEAANEEALLRAREPAAVIADLVGEALARLIVSGLWPA